MRQIFVVLILGLVIGCLAGGNTNAQWRVLERIEKYGDDLTLICTLNKTSQTSSDLKRWYKGEELLSLGDQPTVLYKTKYEAVLFPEGVKLTILNFDQRDVNKTYHCEIGFYKSEEQILSEDKVFKDKRIPAEYGGKNALIIVLPIIGAFILLVMVLIFFLWKKGYINRPLKNRHDQEESQDPTEPILVLPNHDRAENDQNQVRFVIKDELDGAHERTPFLTKGVDSENSQNGLEAIVSNGVLVEPADQIRGHVSRGNNQDQAQSLPIEDTNVAPEEASLLENEVNAENDQNGAEAVLQNGDVDTKDTCVLSIDCQMNTESNQDQDHSTLPKVYSSCLAPYRGIGENIALAISGQIDDVPFQKEKDDFREQNKEDGTDPKSPPCEPINRGPQYTLPDSPLSNLSTEQTFGESQYTNSIAPFRHKDYTKRDFRIKSFTEKMPFSSPSIQEMAEAGFFYTGYETTVRCFSCSKTLNFNEGDNPSDSKCHKPNCLI